MRDLMAGIQVWRGVDRGQTEMGWLHGRHSFSFGQYYNPQRLGYRSLRVLNDDVVEPGGGFGEHGHSNMEIITWILAGELTHADSTGNRELLRPGEVQVMTAGRGIRHSEMNGSRERQVHFLQIWIEPQAQGLEPAYGQRAFEQSRRANQWQLLVSSDGADESMRIHQDARLQVADLNGEIKLGLSIGTNRYGYLHMATGSVKVGDELLVAGDALPFSGPATLELEAEQDSQVLLFDLA